MKTLRDELKNSKFLFKSVRALFLVLAKFLTILSQTWNTLFIYRVRFGRWPDLKNPKLLNEKVMFLKLNRFNKELFSKQCADKYAVRSYVKSCGLGDLLIPLIANYDNPEDVEWNILPNRFFIKWNFGTGLNIRCEDKGIFDVQKATKQLKKWKNNTDYLVTSELQYECEKKQILVEENLSRGGQELPEDYKVYCFNGKPLFVLLCVDRHLGHAKFLMYDTDFNFKPSYTNDGLKYDHKKEYNKPDGFDNILKYAEILAKPFEFVRVDFYIIDGKIYFGEVTLTSSGGRDLDITPEFDKLAGSLIKLQDKYEY
jgi:hypothetical protein